MDNATRELDRLGSASLLHGRTRELQLLSDRARISLDGRCSCLLVSGPPGVGKSAFAEAVRAWFVDSARGFVIRGKYEQFHEDIPYAAFVAAFRQLVDYILTEADAVEFKKWQTEIKQALGKNGMAIVGVVPDLELIIGKQDDPIEPLAPSEERNRFMKICRDFVAAVATRDHPLCIILDDLQWVDAPSLGLLKSILSHSAIGHLFVIITTRTEGKSNNLHLREFLREADAGTFAIQEIGLKDLDETATANLIADLLRCGPTEIVPLSRLIWLKTGGNPFYILRFLQAVTDEGLLKFDLLENRWVWDHDALVTRSVTENIVQFLTGEFLKLRAEMRTFLSRAACIGASFSLSKCWAALGSDERQVHLLAQEAESRGFVTTVVRRSASEDGANSATIASHNAEVFLAFVHDRVQQAARDLVPVADLPGIQLKIGRILLRTSTTETFDEVGSSVLNNLNPVVALVEDPRERRQLGKLNLLAADNARRGLAYREALNKVHAGLPLLSEDAWLSDYDTIFSLSCHGFECAFLVAEFDEAEALFNELIAHAKDNLDRAKVWHTKILLNTTQERYAAAIEVAISALKSFNIQLPKRPEWYHFLIELSKTQLLLRFRKPSDLTNLPQMEDPHHLAAAQLLVAMFPPAYFLNQDLLMLAGLKVVNLSLRKGNSPMSPAGYVIYALALTAALRCPVIGWEFGRLSMDLAERYKIAAFACKPLLIFGAFVNIWRKPLDTSEPILNRALEFCLEAGDLQYANYCVLGLGLHEFVRGAPLDPVLAYWRRKESALRETKDPFAIEAFMQWKQCVKAMIGETDSPSAMTDAEYDEKDAEARIKAGGNTTLLVYFYIRKIFLEAIAGDPLHALKFASQAKPLLLFTPGLLVVVDYHFWSAIAAARVLMRTGSSDKHLKRFLRRCGRTLRRFARYCPDNFEHLAAVVEAEIEAMGNGDLRLFDHAIARATERQAFHIVGVANERVAEWYESRSQLKFAEIYYRDARAAYASWGGKSKLSEIDGRLLAIGGPHLATAAAGDSLTDPAANRRRISTAAMAALNEIKPAGKGIEGEITRLASVALSFLTNDRIMLIAASEQDCRVEAVALSTSGNTQVIFPQRGGVPQDFSRAVANYVRRTRRPLHLSAPLQEERFSRCPYLQAARPTSIYALPIDTADELSGVLVFESYRAGGADDNAIAVADVIGGELSVVVQRYRLARQLTVTQESLADTQNRLENVSRFVPRAVQGHVWDPSNPLHWVKDNKSVAILFLDIAGYTKKCEDLERSEIVDLVQQYFSVFLDEAYSRGGDMCDMTGDELMFLFQGDDLRALTIQALESALAIRARAETLNTRLAGQFPAVTVNMGLHSGIAMVGPMKLEGVIEHRWIYSATGTSVNLASRIREKASGGSILLSEDSARLAGESYMFRDLGRRRLKNVSNPMRLFEIMRD